MIYNYLLNQIKTDAANAIQALVDAKGQAVTMPQATDQIDYYLWEAIRMIYAIAAKIGYLIEVTTYSHTRVRVRLRYDCSGYRVQQDIDAVIGIRKGVAGAINAIDRIVDKTDRMIQDDVDVESLTDICDLLRLALHRIDNASAYVMLIDSRYLTPGQTERLNEMLDEYERTGISPEQAELDQWRRCIPWLSLGGGG